MCNDRAVLFQRALGKDADARQSLRDIYGNRITPGVHFPITIAEINVQCLMDWIFNCVWRCIDYRTEECHNIPQFIQLIRRVATEELPGSDGEERQWIGLIADIQNRDDIATRKFRQKFEPIIRGYIRSQFPDVPGNDLPADVITDAVLKIQESKYTHYNIASLVEWIKKSAKWGAMKELNRGKRVQDITPLRLQETEEDTDSAPLPQDELLFCETWEEAAKRLRKCGINDRHIDLIQSYYAWEWSQDECANALGYNNAASVKTTLARIREKLLPHGIHLERYDDEK